MFTQAMMRAATGETPADLVLKNAVVLNVFTKELIRADVAICQDIIVGLGEYEGVQELDLTGKFIVPGFIDAHLHIESSMLLPEQFGAEIAPWGTTTVLADPHEIANVAGLDGIRFLMQNAKKASCNFLFMLPSCVPATGFDDSGARLNAQNLLTLKTDPQVLGLGEMMNYQGVLDCDAEVMEKLIQFSDRVIDGHAPGVKGKRLQGYLLAGIHTDHECSEEEEVVEKLRSGMAILAREGSAAKNLEAVVKAALNHHLDFDRIAFCTDDRHVEDIRREGHMNVHIRKAIQLGVDPITAYCCATWNPARIYGLSATGAVAPGYFADLVILNSLFEVEIDSVFYHGKKVARTSPIPSAVPEQLGDTVHTQPLSLGLFRLPCKDGKYPVIELIPHQINTKLRFEELPHENGAFIADSIYQKIAVLERHRGLSVSGIGVVKGFSLQGAIASTVAHDSHNLIVIGSSDEEMLLAAQILIQQKGGYAAVQGKNVLAQVPLPVCGLMSDQTADFVQEKTAQFIRAARQIGIPEGFDPFQTLSFLSLPVIPEVRITNRGIFDSQSFSYLPFQPQPENTEPQPNNADSTLS